MLYQVGAYGYDVRTFRFSQSDFEPENLREIFEGLDYLYMQGVNESSNSRLFHGHSISGEVTRFNVQDNEQEVRMQIFHNKVYCDQQRRVSLLIRRINRSFPISEIK